MAVVRTQGASTAAGATATAATGDMGGGKWNGSGNGKMDQGGQAEMDQNGRERVVLLMHETRVLTASDATRVLLLLAREVRLRSLSTNLTKHEHLREIDRTSVSVLCDKYGIILYCRVDFLRNMILSSINSFTLFFDL